VSRRPVLSDVAKLAQTSTATVSRVLSGRGAVAKSTADRVNEAVEATGFVLNQRRSAAARTRRMPRDLKHGTIGFLLFGEDAPSANLAHLHENVRGMILDAALAAGDAADVRIQVCRMTGSELERGVIPQSVAGARLDGLVAQSAPIRNYAILEKVAPVVCFGSHPTPACTIPSVEPENAQALDVVIQSLFELGHRRYAFMMDSRRGRPPHQSYLMRLRAFQDSVEARGCTGEVHEAPRAEADIEEMLTAYTARPADERPTAFVCSTDGAASRMLSALAARGIRVPADVSVTGFDNLSIGEVLFPPLTTWAPDWGLVGRTCFEFLLARARGESVPLRTFVGGKLHVRASTGPAAEMGDGARAGEHAQVIVRSSTKEEEVLEVKG
jgi:LacI family transcriptional regulator, galactose operon repressor